MKTINKTMGLRRRGSVLASVLLSTVILFAIGTGLLSLSLHGQTLAIRTGKEVAARCAADAGLAKVVFEMNEKLKVKPWDDSTLPQVTDEALPNSNATFSYTVTGDIESGFTIECIGKSGQAERKVTCALPLEGPFESAIFADAGMSMENGAVVNWYNYTTDDENLQVGTGSIEPGAIDLKTGVTVNGDVVVGVGGDPDVVINAGWATITGETYALSESYEWPTITVPEALQQLPSGGALNDSATITTSGRYDSINLDNGAIITVDGPVTLYITGEILIKNSAQLQVVDGGTNPDAFLILYLDGNLECQNTSAINNQSRDAKKLKVYGLNGCQSMIFKNNSEFYGAIYAPNADVIFHNSADGFGAVAAKSFDQKNSATFSYDASLRDVSINDEAVRFVVRQWREE